LHVHCCCSGGPDVVYPSLDAFMADLVKGSFDFGMEFMGKAAQQADLTGGAMATAASTGAVPSTQSAPAAGTTGLPKQQVQQAAQVTGQAQAQALRPQGMAQVLAQEQVQAASAVFREG
jgi:hypothetical protein